MLASRRQSVRMVLFCCRPDYLEVEKVAASAAGSHATPRNSACQRAFLPSARSHPRGRRSATIPPRSNPSIRCERVRWKRTLPMLIDARGSGSMVVVFARSARSRCRSRPRSPMPRWWTHRASDGQLPGQRPDERAGRRAIYRNLQSSPRGLRPVRRSRDFDRLRAPALLRCGADHGRGEGRCTVAHAAACRRDRGAAAHRRAATVASR